MKATALAVLLLATVSCSLIAGEGEEQQASLELIVPLRSSLGDPAGMAGIRVEVTGAGPTRVYRAADFMGPKLQPFPVPDSGRITVAVQVEQDGETVAQGSASWNLRTGARWWMEIERGYRARLGHTDRDECNENECPQNRRLQCINWYCQGTWRFGVREDAAQVERESLWMTLFRMLPGECADICP